MVMNFLKKFEMLIRDVGNKKTLQAITDYPLTDEELRENEVKAKEFDKLSAEEQTKYFDAPTFPDFDRLKKVTIISYDRNKYCYILYKGRVYDVKSGYLYRPSLIKEYYRYSEGYTFKPYSYDQLCQLPSLEFID